MILPHIKNKALKLFLALTLTTSPTGIYAQDAEDAPIRPVLSAFTVGGGTAHLADTYLTPLKYDGWSTAVNYERLQAAKFNPRWTLQLKISADLDRTQNPARNAELWCAQLHASWGMLYRWHLPLNITGALGPSLTAEGGCLYNNRNGNNPASAKGAVTLDATGYLARNFKLWQLPVTLRYMPTMPIIGAFFGPHYDELYYEMYLGNHSGLVHPAWWGNRFVLNHLVSADFHFGSTALRLGYECNWMSSRVSNITTRIITHRLVLGVTVDWSAIKRNANVIRVM